MADNRNFAALDWLVHEISETLQEARQALEAYVENVQDSTQLRACLTFIHQVHGSLQMMEFFGAAMLADEMERLTQAMLQGSVANADEAHEVLMRGILQFPTYLEQVKLARNDNPLVILPLLHDLRAVRGESLLTDTNLFVPNLAPAKKITGIRVAIDNVQFQAMALKLRQMFQYAAAGFIRSASSSESLAYLEKVFVRLHKLTQGTARQALWDICLALVEALETDVLDMSASLKNLLRQLDKEIKILAVYGLKSLNSYTDDELIKNLLYYVARAGKNTLYFKEDSHLKRIYETYHLADALIEGDGSGPQNDLLSAPDAEAMRSVIDALNVELNMVKLALNECITDEYGQQRLVEVAPIIKRIADTMAVLGLAPLRQRVLEQGLALEAMASATRGSSQDELMAVASSIIAVEHELEGLGQAQQSSPAVNAPSEGDITLMHAKESVLRESRQGLERTKNAIVEYIASQWDRKHLHDVPATLREVRGGLGIIAQPEAARIIEACAAYIEEQLLAQEFTPQWSKLDSLADAIASVEYYLERVSSGVASEENDVLLTVAEESVALLGYGVRADNPRATAMEEAPSPTIPVLRDHYVDDVAEGSAADEAHLAAAYQSALQVESIEDASTAAAISGAAARARAQITDENVVEKFAPYLPEEYVPEEGFSEQHLFDERLAEENLSNETAADITPHRDGVDTEEAQSHDSQINEPVANYSVSSTAVDAPVHQHDEDEDEVDEEIIEIFVEEAGEVLTSIDEFFPLWAQNFEDVKSLTEFRRAFHTLKGSGRMVKATDIARLGWAVENMLNRLLDHTVTPDKVHVTIIEKVRDILPDMIAAFGAQSGNPHLSLTDQYCAMAESLAHGVMPDALLNQIPAADEQQGAALAEENNSGNEELPVISAPQESLSGKDRDSDGEDEQLWDIFAGEALIHLQAVEEFIAHIQAEAPCYEVLSDDVQRALHTLKGSAYMAGVIPVADLVSPLEKLAKDLRSYQVIVSDDVLNLLSDGVGYIHEALRKIAQREAVDIPELHTFVNRVAELHNKHIEPLAHQQIMGDNLSAVDPKILSMFMTEELNLLLHAEPVIREWQANPENNRVLGLLLDELRQLTRGARLAGLPILEFFSEKAEHVYAHILEKHLACTDALCDTLNATHAALLDMMDTIAAGQNLTRASTQLQASLDEWILQAEASALSLPEQVDEYSQGDAVSLRSAETPPVELPSESVTREAAEDNLANIEESALDDPLAENMLVQAIAEIESEQLPVVSPVSIDINDPHVDAEPVQEKMDDHGVGDEALQREQSILETLAAEAAHIQQPAPISYFFTGTEDDEDFDPEIIEIFIEEAMELLEDIERALHQWQDDISDPQPVEELKRYLHTFKGGARLAGLAELGDLSHDFESVLIDIDDNTDINQALFAKLNNYQDLLHKGVAQTRTQLDADYVTAENAAQNQAAAQRPSQSALTPAATPGSRSSDMETSIETGLAGKDQKPNLLTFAPKAKPATAQLPQIPGSEFVGGHQSNSGQGATQHLASRRTGPQEVVKVPAELLEELVNLAGETSISRGRMQQQVMDLSGAIGEMDSTILRLQEQLRRLDIETEAQVAFRQEKMAQHEEFDPLEMDRYSQLQQLSRSLMESASDLMDLKYTLADKTRDAETLLLQQSRINTDLQEGLMRSRMVPFSRLVPRLRRIVRQAAIELGKEVDFELNNVEGEMDRTVLERMVAPLEHMLRNAVDHGIESQEERLAAGKPAVGRIALSLSREGSDVMLRLADDGRGINLQRVREKAVERGLISADAKLSDQDLMQFIMHAGFSTADKVTQISGRGVGMDVVHAEIKQLGGAMFIDSRWGEGAEFIIRLPFTVSVNRALMVQIGDDLYAIPLNTIEGIVRVSPFELEHYYQDQTARFDYAGEHYLVRYLGTMLDSSAHPKLDGQVLPLPVVLVRSAEVTVALQVDRLLGSREIVVKTLGAQFSAVQGVSGATVMGDGSVVVILDLHALIREQLALGLGHSVLLEPYKFQSPVEHENVDKIIMVVDDSVTVRKVTTRFLERENYRVITAKDGIEALQLLQENVPDVMLLDIEMPRMDGFEVAKNIRSSSRLKELPIIMITSRTGDKHRERALDLGVDKYMGKPYQEDLLLANIEELLAKSIR